MTAQTTRTRRPLDFGALLHGSGGHLAAWRYPGGTADGELDLAHHVAVAKTLEAGGFSAIFVADVVAIWGHHLDSLSRTTRASYFEPLTLLSALAAVTERIGLVATVTTSYNEPYNVARKFASLDHLSGGRAGWNVVTSVVPLEAANYGREEHFSHADRYRKAAEFVDIVTALWDSFDDASVIRDREAGRYFLPGGRSAIDHVGEFFSVAGPLNTSRPPQGHPVIFQAGASETGRRFAATVGEVIFAAPHSIDEAIGYRNALDRDLAEAGRSPDDVRVWPVLTPFIGSTESEARAKHERLLDLVHDDVLRRAVQDNVGDTDLSDADLDAPLPDIPDTNRSKSRREGILHLARTEQLTLRDLGRRLVGSGTVGTPEQIADHIEHWWHAGAADGFNVSFPVLPEDARLFVDHVLPVLERRGSFQPHLGATLRETLGLAKPALPAHRAAARIEARA
ncbi:LLM class flavin-dependent oxidoreductase [Plantibacter sp. YIM 135249]|uniref:LLM class flavin-dependent oxidoreductase n=1 Tax=Plantibacter sp. YIM 135249 TaxID=3423918 RepID=UPI003D358DE0